MKGFVKGINSIENPSRIIGSEDQIPKKRQCNCKRSNCLKLYCECFNYGIYCSSTCNCGQCFNNLKYESFRRGITEMILERNPSAFRSKVQNGVLGNTFGSKDSLTVRHFKGCQCKKSFCLKKYCECFQAKMFCDRSKCRCLQCKNVEETDQTSQDIKLGVSLEEAEGRLTDGVSSIEEGHPLEASSSSVRKDVGMNDACNILNTPKSDGQQCLTQSIDRKAVCDQKTSQEKTTPTQALKQPSPLSPKSGDPSHIEGSEKNNIQGAMTVMAQLPPAPSEVLVQVIESTPGLYASLLQEDKQFKTDATQCLSSSSSSSSSSSTSYLSSLLSQSMMDDLCLGLLEAGEKATVGHKRCVETDGRSLIFDNGSNNKKTKVHVVEEGRGEETSSSSSDRDSSILDFLECKEPINRSQLMHLYPSTCEEESSTSSHHWHSVREMEESSRPSTNSLQLDASKNEKNKKNHQGPQNLEGEDVSATSDREVRRDALEENAVKMKQHLAMLQHLSVSLRNITTSLTERRGGIPPYR